MLELRNITKTYILGKPKDQNYQKVHALQGVSIHFRGQEFVSILGPSGCGKTTLLNIIGGLDQYTDGDLVINDVSTKDFKDRDWDEYRNHKIGFVFQSYNLIPHQTVLENVELALTLSGVSKDERKKKAVEALTKVGLSDKINAKPTQLSGGQMQRVAIARAIVNDPDIILADEPTGALDTKTSLQVMDLLKEISKEKLIIMVTHNPSLAEKYSTRIIKLLDGRITDDTSPFNVKDAPKTTLEDNKDEKKFKSMSFLTALSLSWKNLLTKKGRTILVSFAGSIGIIGIALILSLSSGFQNYINTVQQDTLSTYPLTITTEQLNYTSALETLMNPPTSDKEVEDGHVGVNTIMSDIFDSVLSSSSVNNLANLKSYIDDNEEKFSKFIVKETYDVNYNIYSEDGLALEPMTVFTDLIRKIGEQYEDYIEANPDLGLKPVNYESYINRFGLLDASVFSEMIDSPELIKGQYDLVEGEWPNNYDEAILVLNENDTINDFYLYGLDLIETPTLDDIAEGILENFINNQTNNKDDENTKYEVNIDDIPTKKIFSTRYRIFGDGDFYFENEEGKYYDIREEKNNQDDLDSLINNENKGINLKIVGIVKPNENASAHSISTPIGYLPSLTIELVKQNENSDVVIAQKASPDINVITRQPFPTNVKEEDEMKNDIISFYNSYLVSSEASLEMVEANPMLPVYLQQVGVTDYKDYEKVKEALIGMVNEVYENGNFMGFYPMTIQDLYNMIFTSETTYEQNLKSFGVIDLTTPASISFYCIDFEDKKELTSLIEEYNELMRNDINKGESYVITYTDYAGLMMDSISVIITAISYVLIAFVSVSLIVSSIMIGIITYISVLERTKEIGVLRSIGASKKDIKHVFTAESLIIGFMSGALGLIVTVILDLPISIIINAITGIPNVAVLPWLGAIILLLLSCLLTFIAGLIPSNIASKKEPVVCLRSE